MKINFTFLWFTKYLLIIAHGFIKLFMFYLRNKVSYLDVYQDIITGWSRDQIPSGFMED